jgi:ribosome-binding factor A
MTRSKSSAARPAAATQRQLRVGEELRHAIARLLERGELHDPDLAGRSITVTEVRVSPDLKNATVFVMPLGGRGEAEALAALKRARAYIRSLVAHEVQLRHAPQFSFVLDTSFDNAVRIETLLRDVAPGPADQDDGPKDSGNGA